MTNIRPRPQFALALFWSATIAAIFVLASASAAKAKEVLHTLNSGLVTVSASQEADLNVVNLSDTAVGLDATILDADGNKLESESLKIGPGLSGTVTFTATSAMKVRAMVSIMGLATLLCDRFKPTLEVLDSTGNRAVIENFTHIDLPVK